MRRGIHTLDTAHDAFIGMGSDGRIVTWNSQAEATFGWTRDEVVGQPLVETIIPPSYRDAHLKGMRRFHETGETRVIGHLLELTALHRDGREFPIEITISNPMTRGDGYYFGAFLRNISNRRQREEELRQAKNSAEAATRAKSEFLANMSHELRTPLNGILGYAQLLRRDRNLAITHQEAVDAIAQCAAHLLDLINDVLDLSKIEAGKIDVEQVATDLRRLVADVQQWIAESARRKGLGFEVHVAADLPHSVVLDGRHLRQILINLLGNAVKFTREGSVVLAVARQDGRIRFDVSDTGIGIDPQNAGMIFDAFSQTLAGAEEGGTGLGLTISQRLARQMGGKIRVESRSEGGSLFWFDVPLVVGERAEEDLLRQASDRDLDTEVRVVAAREITALVVDDHSINRRMLAVLLESLGVHSITAVDGAEGIELARRYRPEVILMDLRMKGMDGIEATRRLQAEPATADIPVLAVTASSFESLREAALAAGCRALLTKPVRAADLMAAIERLLGKCFEPVAAPLSPADDQMDELLSAAVVSPVAERLREAAAIGNVSELSAIARELSLGDHQQALLGRRIVRLVNQFEFDAIARLASGGQTGDSASEG